MYSPHKLNIISESNVIPGPSISPLQYEIVVASTLYALTIAATTATATVVPLAQVFLAKLFRLSGNTRQKLLSVRDHLSLTMNMNLKVIVGWS